MLKIGWVEWSNAIPDDEGWYFGYWNDGTIETVHIDANDLEDKVLSIRREGITITMTHWAIINIAPPDPV